MQVLEVSDHQGRAFELDLCFDCHGLWFDARENLRLSPTSVIGLLRELHAHRDAAHRPQAARLACPRCDAALATGFDIARVGGRFVTHRCPQGHGRFSSFQAFLIEKGFVRPLSPADRQALAQQVGPLHCGACGGPVDVRRDDACPWCRSPLALLDPQAVRRALDEHAAAASARAAAAREAAPGTADASALADALMAVERAEAQALRARQLERAERWRGDAAGGVDLWAFGLDRLRDALR